MKGITILRVDPDKRAIATMSLKVGRKNAAPLIQRVVRARTLGWRELITVNDVTLVVAAGTEVSEEMRGWRLLGGEDTAGIGILFGRGENGGMVSVPVDRAWVEHKIRWLDGEDVQGTRERAEATLPLMSDDVREAMAGAVPALADGSLWLTQDAKPLWQIALALGLTTPSTQGQRLSPMGVMVHDMLPGEFH